MTKEISGTSCFSCEEIDVGVGGVVVDEDALDKFEQIWLRFASSESVWSSHSWSRSLIFDYVILQWSLTEMYKDFLKLLTSSSSENM